MLDDGWAHEPGEMMVYLVRVRNKSAKHLRDCQLKLSVGHAESEYEICEPFNLRKRCLGALVAVVRRLR